jgi:hypothetical protein
MLQTHLLTIQVKCLSTEVNLVSIFGSPCKHKTHKKTCKEELSAACCVSPGMGSLLQMMSKSQRTRLEDAEGGAHNNNNN